MQSPAVGKTETDMSYDLLTFMWVHISDTNCSLYNIIVASSRVGVQ